MTNTDLKDVKYQLGYALDDQEHSLQRLHYWLKYAGMSGGLIGGSFWLPFGLLIIILVAIAVLFAPYMLWHLAKARWYRSIVYFMILVVIPFAVSRLMTSEVSVLRYLLTASPLLTFYVYTWWLRYRIGEHLREMQLVREIEYRPGSVQ